MHPPDATLPPRTVERWLSSFGRRQLVVVAGVLMLSSLSTLLFADAMATTGLTVTWHQAFPYRLLEVGLWALLFEPVYWLVRRGSKRIGVALFLACQLPLSFGAASLVPPTYAFLEDGLFEMSLRERVTAERRAQFEARGDEARPRPRREFRPPMGGRAFRYRDSALLYYWMLLGLAWGVDAYLGKRSQERRAREIAERATHAEKELVVSRLANLRSQLHPHFFFNTLHSVNGLILDGRHQDALSTLADLGELLRSTLDLSDHQEITLGEELRIIERYLAIEKVRYADRLQTDVRTPDDLATARIPALVLLALVENAVKHGVAARTAGGRVAISAWAENGRLYLNVSDNGPGFDPALLDNSNLGNARGVGLANAMHRLAALYGQEAGTTLTNLDEGGASATLWFPRRGGTTNGACS